MYNFFFAYSDEPFTGRQFPWDFIASGGPYYETLRLAVDPTNGVISRDSVLSNQIQDIYMSI